MPPQKDLHPFRSFDVPRGGDRASLSCGLPILRANITYTSASAPPSNKTIKLPRTRRATHLPLKDDCPPRYILTFLTPQATSSSELDQSGFTVGEKEGSAQSAPVGARPTPTARASTWTTTGTSASLSWRTQRTTSSTSGLALAWHSSKQYA